MINNLGEKTKETRSLEPEDKNVSAQAEMETASTDITLPELQSCQIFMLYFQLGSHSGGTWVISALRACSFCQNTLLQTQTTTQKRYGSSLCPCPEGVKAGGPWGSMVDPRDQCSNLIKKGHQSSTPSAWEPAGWGRIKIRRYSPGARGFPHQLIKLGKPSRTLLSFLLREINPLVPSPHPQAPYQRA